jgi:hypothetical protein
MHLLVGNIALKPKNQGNTASGAAFTVQPVPNTDDRLPI